MPARSQPSLVLALTSALAGCHGTPSHEVRPERDGGPELSDGGLPDATPGDCDGEPVRSKAALRINEALSDNDGVNVDELGETDDWIELVNTGDDAIDLSEFTLSDDSHEPVPLPPHTLAPGKTLVLWADGDLDQGALHLPFKLDADGDTLVLREGRCRVVDEVELPALALNDSFARLPDGSGDFVACHYATPARANGDHCEPPEPPALPEDVTFEPYDWPEVFPSVTGPLVITELALRPSGFIEVLNAGSEVAQLADYELRLASFAPGASWPSASDGSPLAWPVTSLAPGERALLPVSASDVSALDASAEYEGVVSLFDATEKLLDRVDFMRWPSGTTLVRFPENAGHFRFCAEASPGAPNTDCELLASRDVGDRVHHLRAAGDFGALAAGGTHIGLEAVKFVVDMDAGDVVHLLGSERWALHYTFIRERIDLDPVLDRCDREQARAFNEGWYAFSQKNYFVVEGRRYLLGTLVRHASGMHTVEFANGDVISPAQMRRAFFAAVAHTDDPKQWALRPGEASQIERMREIEGTVPIVGPNAPFQGLTYQPLTQAVGYGELRFVRSDELEDAELGPRIIVITDGVPNDIPFVGALITEAFQTPLAHVNVLSRARGTPNMALRHARTDPRLAPLLGKLVRLEVGPAGFDVREATPEEADAFWQAQKPTGATITPPLDDTLRGAVSLDGRGLADLPALGAKAAQFAELYRVDEPHRGCDASTVPLRVPENALGIPVAHYLDHFEQSGARVLLEALLDDPRFRADPEEHLAGLAAVREKMLAHPVDATFLRELEATLRATFGTRRLRFRSSSNTEDLPTFNGAGLHTSTAVQLDDRDLSLEDGLRLVWSSLWNTRAFDERDHANIDQLRAAMGILVHEAQSGEGAQGVGISRDMLDVSRSSTYYINAQIGEASVTNPAPGVVTEQLLYTWPPRTPEISYRSLSSLTGGEPVLSLDEKRAVACALGAVHDHFRPLLDPERANRVFAMQIEFKLTRDTRDVVIKQARLQPFAGMDLPTDCRDYN